VTDQEENKRRDEEDINDFLDGLEQAAANIKNDKSHDKNKVYVNGNHDDDHLAEQFHSLPTDYDQPSEPKV